MADSKPLITRHLHTVIKKATRQFCNIFSLLARYSALTQTNNVTIYKLIIRFILTYAVPVRSSTRSPTTSDSRLSSQNVSESSLIIPDVPPLPTALNTKHWTHPSYHTPTYSQIFAHSPPPQPRNPTSRELYTSRSDTCTGNIEMNNEIICCYNLMYIKYKDKLRTHILR